MVNLSEAKCLDYPRFIISALLLIFSCVCTCYAIVEEKTNFYNGVPGWAALILFITILFWLGVMEGLQVALVELKRQDPQTYRHSHPHAYKLGQMAAKGDNVERFLMGRQMFVVFIVFFAAKLTAIHSESGDDFLFPIPDWFRSIFLETGILACVLVVILAQLMPQIIAAKHPVAFLEFWIMRPGYYACIFLESTGITHITWVLSHFIAYLCGMQEDDHKSSELYEKCLNDEMSIKIGSKKLIRQETQDSAFSDEPILKDKKGKFVRQDTAESEFMEQPMDKTKYSKLYLPN